jgi:hypothetical protein
MEDGMESFWDRDGVVKHDDFVKWLDENPEGFFINCRSASNMMLHRSTCPHLVFHVPVSLTRYRKICSLDRAQLERWADEHGSKPVRSCSTCSPRA